MNDKVKCKLCNGKGVQGTVLCREHLDGFEYARGLLCNKQGRTGYNIAEGLLSYIQQPKGSDNGKGK